MKPIVRVEKLSKQYLIGARETSYGTLRESIVDAVRAPFARLRGRNGKQTSETIWALKNVSFEVAPGEVVGVIGRNGAGKSTLLKVLSRITEPTTGRVDLYGRVASLLEVGTGFHPELTGRENIYLNGAILGMRKAEIERKFDEIVAFAELEKFLDTPVKRYSSGMYMRLAFAVSSHLEPEILIVDEVLAVGDAAFQKKCLGKLDEVAKAGRTVLFVSHNMLAVQSLCTRVVWLDQGEILDQGPARQVVSKYLKTALVARVEQTWDHIDTAPGNEQVRVRRACVGPADGSATDLISVKTPVMMEFEYWNLVPDAYLNLSVVVSTKEGHPIFNTGSGGERVWHNKPFPAGLFRSRFHIPGDLLNDGTHRVHLYVVKDQTVVIYDIDDVLVFDVEEASERSSGWYGKWVGAVRPNLNWQTELLAESAPPLPPQ
jgi:homopolymeric O-antigen transport system ATP-binding protein